MENNIINYLFLHVDKVVLVEYQSRILIMRVLHIASLHLLCHLLVLGLIEPLIAISIVEMPPEKVQALAHLHVGRVIQPHLVEIAKDLLDENRPRRLL